MADAASAGGTAQKSREGSRQSEAALMYKRPYTTDERAQLAALFHSLSIPDLTKLPMLPTEMHVMIATPIAVPPGYRGMCVIVDPTSIVNWVDVYSLAGAPDTTENKAISRTLLYSIVSSETGKTITLVNLTGHNTTVLEYKRLYPADTCFETIEGYHAFIRIFVTGNVPDRANLTRVCSAAVLSCGMRHDERYLGNTRWTDVMSEFLAWFRSHDKYSNVTCHENGITIGFTCNFKRYTLNAILGETTLKLVSADCLFDIGLLYDNLRDDRYFDMCKLFITHIVDVL